MIVLNKNDKLIVTLNEAVNKNQLYCYVSYEDIGSVIPGSFFAITNNNNDVEIVKSPYNKRIVKFIMINNADDAQATVILKINSKGVEFKLIKVIVNPGNTLQLVGSGFIIKEQYIKLTDGTDTFRHGVHDNGKYGVDYWNGSSWDQIFEA